MDEKDERKKIVAVYIFFFVSFFALFSPNLIVSLFATLLVICTLSVAYSIRSKADEDSLTENHMTLLIRTFWRTNLYLIFTISAAAIYLVIFLDYSPIYPCISYIESNALSLAQSDDTTALMNLFTPCTKPFMQANGQNVILSAFIAFAPIVLYLIYRLILGAKNLKTSTNVKEKKL